MLESRWPSAVAQLVPDYDLLRRIGAGAYGEVWLARSKATGTLRAAKIVLRQKFEDDRPFQREFEGIQRFERVSREHPSQLALFHIGRNDMGGYFYYVMELADAVQSPRSTTHCPQAEPRSPKSKAQSLEPIPSTESGSSEAYLPHTLRADLAQGRLPAERVLGIGLALSEALAHLHENGLVHRDVKPSNVIFVNGRPKLADIGLVTDASDQCSIVGTEGYLPPEGPGTPQADIFALGKVLYEAATGLDRRSFPKLPDDLRDWPDRQAMVELNEIVLRGCAKEAASRYSTCQEMHDELALLERGKSVKFKRTVQGWLSVARKLGLGIALAAALATTITILRRGSAASANAYPDGQPSTNMEAAALSDRAMKILRGSLFTEFGTAWTNFHRAIVLDPNFVQPYVGLLEIHLREHFPGMPETTREIMQDIAAHLERLAPCLAATYCAKSLLAWEDCNFPEAEREVLEAVKANPDYELGHTWHAWLLLCFGRPDEAFIELKKTQAIMPSHVIVFWGMGNTYYVKRDFTNSIEWFSKAVDWDQQHVGALDGMGRSLMALGKYAESLRYFEEAAVFSGSQDAASAKHGNEILRNALEKGGSVGYWQQLWTWEENNTNQNLYLKAQIQLHLGNTDRALDLLQADYDEHRRNPNYNSDVNMMLYDDCWDGLHNNPRFKKFLREVGFTKVMRPPAR